MSSLFKVWKYAIGSFSDDTTKPYDNKVALIRTFWVLLHIVTCFSIIANFLMTHII
jgi:hypothetical protein